MPGPVLGAVFVIDRNGEAMPFPSARDAEMDLEAVDVLAGEYVAFGLDGRVVELRAVGDDVLLVATGRWDLGGLRRRVRDHHVRLRLESAPDDVVAAVNELFRRDWDGRWPKRPHWLDRRLHGSGSTQI